MNDKNVILQVRGLQKNFGELEGPMMEMTSPS